MKGTLGIIMCILVQLALVREVPAQGGSLDCDILITDVRDSLSSSQSSRYFDSVAVDAKMNRDTCVLFCSRIRQAAALDEMGMADSALTQLYWVNNHFDFQCDSTVLISLYANLTSVYLALEETDRVDSIAEIIQSGWESSGKEGFVKSRLAILSNQAVGHATYGEFQRAMSEFHQILVEARREGSNYYIQRTLGNIGALKGVMEEIDSAVYYINEASRYGDEDIRSVISGYMNLSLAYLDRGELSNALIALDSAENLNGRLQDMNNLATIYDIRSEIYSQRGNSSKAYSELRNYTDLYEDILNEERLMAAAEMMEKYESEKQAREIQQLRLESIDAELEKQRIRNARNTSFFGALFVLGGAVVLWSRLRLVRRSRDEVAEQRDVADGLLRNILPATVAEELKDKGTADAQYFETASILFTDFSHFTEISSQMSAQELVALLNKYFRKFDEIVGEYGLEKIKTIGDAYMATASIPKDNTAGPADVVLTALDMMDYVSEQFGQEGHHFEMRAGVHTGPVVAGIVGVKKFQYDIWGDSVNIASRMESNSEPGRVNISSETYEILRNDSRFAFESRGMIHAKGVGKVAMYFVQRSVV